MVHRRGEKNIPNAATVPLDLDLDLDLDRPESSDRRGTRAPANLGVPER
jgi:hypothetical protein